MAGEAGEGVISAEAQDARLTVGSSARGTEGGRKSAGAEGAEDDLAQKSVRSGVARLSAW